jgi:fumarate hydratase subunit beta
LSLIETVDMNAPSPVRINTPFDPAALRALRSGDRVLVSGIIYAARDAAHKRMIEALDQHQPLPVNLRGQCVYYVGPTPAPPGRAIGSAGPTTSGRMDPYTPRLLEQGLLGMIGKGNRSPAVLEALRRHGAVYFAATGGAGALLARRITGYRVLAYPELGPEALAELTVQDFPVIVVADSRGNDLYVEGRKAYQRVWP